MELQIKEVAKRKKIKMTVLAAKIGIPRRTLYYWIDVNITFNDLNQVAKALDCSLIELIKPGQGFTHWYDSKGEYRGFLK